jgi:copper resistance protein B
LCYAGIVEPFGLYVLVTVKRSLLLPCLVVLLSLALTSGNAHAALHLSDAHSEPWVRFKAMGHSKTAQQQFLYDRAISTYFDLQGGLRSDLDSRPSRNWAAFGIQGFAPYFFDLELTGCVSGEGHLAAKLEASYDLLITQRLILQPQVELNLYSKSDPTRLVGAGFSDIDTGLRLRYEFSRKFAPYLGVVYDGKFGQTANFAWRTGESTGDVRFVFGVRVWF